MSDDDGSHADPAPSDSNVGCRVGCLIAGLTVFFLGGLYLAGQLTQAGEADSTLLGRIALSAGAIAGALAFGWATIAVGRRSWSLWRFWIRGEKVTATIEELSVDSDYEGDPQIRARVSGRTSKGWTFDRWLVVGYSRDPGPVGSPIDVRYHTGMRRVGRVGRGLGGLITNAILWVISIGTLAFLIAMVAFMVDGLVSLWF